MTFFRPYLFHWAPADSLSSAVANFKVRNTSNAITSIQQNELKKETICMSIRNSVWRTSVVSVLTWWRKNTWPPPARSNRWYSVDRRTWQRWKMRIRRGGRRTARGGSCRWGCGARGPRARPGCGGKDSRWRATGRWSWSSWDKSIFRMFTKIWPATWCHHRRIKNF